jgi:hypothetical protein
LSRPHLPQLDGPRAPGFDCERKTTGTKYLLYLAG